MSKLENKGLFPIKFVRTLVDRVKNGENLNFKKIKFCPNDKRIGGGVENMNDVL
jgi:hypothetical protein